MSVEPSAQNPNDTISIVGLAVATCLGVDIESTWHGVENGRSGVGAMSELESPVATGRDGGQAKRLPADFSPELTREARYLRWTIDNAIRAASIDLAAFAPERISLVLGTTLHGMRAGGEFLRTGDYSKLANFLAGDIARLATAGLPIGGASLTTCSACSSSLGAIALGATLLRTNQADLVIAGGYDAISEYAYAGFDALRLVSEPPLRPFARGRSGMKVGEGYGILLLVRRHDADRVKLPTLATVAGCGESADAFHLTRPHPEGTGALVAMRQACASAGIRPEQLDLIAAHATGTFENDNSEAAAITTLLGERSHDVPIVGMKSHLGHTLGGAGAVELALSVKAIQQGVLPPTANACEVEYAAISINTTRHEKAIVHTLNTSLGFGGANTCVVLRAPSAPSPSPGTTGEGRGEGSSNVERPRIAQKDPHPNPLPAYRERGLNPGDVVITGIGVLTPKSGRMIDDADYESLIPNARRLRRMSTYVKLSICAATMAAREAKLLDAPALLRETGAILGTMHGSAGYCYEYYEQVVREGMATANPMLFAEGVPNAAAAQLSLTLGLTGACQTILGTRTAGLDAIYLASLRIAAGEADRLIVCAGEESHPVLDAAYAAVCKGPPSVSLAVAFVLEPREAAERRSVPILGTVGHGVLMKQFDGESTTDFQRRSIASSDRSRIRRASADLAGGSAFSVEPLLALAERLRNKNSDNRPFAVHATDLGLSALVELE